MSDFSLFALFTAGLACVVPFADAYTQPVGANPLGNPIYTPNSGDIVPAGKEYNITWGPTTTGTVTLLLLKGPSTNAVPQYAIVESIANSGSYLWTPSTDLEPTKGATGYGIQLIVDASGQYQYSTQFGISNDGHDASSGSSSGAAPASHDSSAANSSAMSSAAANVTAVPTPYSPGTAPMPTVPGTASTGYLPGINSIVQPTGGMTVPTSLQTTPAKSQPGGPAYTSALTSASTTGAVSNSASGLTTSFAGLVIAAGVAVFAL
ncbi:Ser-Thr-rich glycosyl-phosphatidyl-inositol-anchored membrane family [Teratosphaeria destructans]|uniref:Ser-Thr-rich glycosyl-phosphatidyl-inositol-anchored membrane family n=1 Tax=Teratosphaeria destructans TaxID=418781 RepID=A0A9W7W475_9PEZI|nr:Ser-Thr-rich glycosyl-phosphatidyl-inositol-anchored membrane family [Teratosphaeria destructans]